MYRRRTQFAIAAALLVVTAGTVDAAKYRYGRGYSQGGGDQAGVIVYLEGGFVNARNSNLVLATSESRQLFGGGVNAVTPLTPASEDDFAGRFGAGYQWANGNRLTVSFWNFNTTSSASAEGPLGGLLHYAIGPPIALGGGTYVGDSGAPGFFDLATETTATTADIAFGRSHEIGDEFSLEWSTGLRYAHFEETVDGFYDDALAGAVTFGDQRYDVAKSTDGEMFGVRVSMRGRYFFTPSLSISSGIGFSFLDGELNSTSGLTPSGLVNATIQPASFAGILDDGRSGHTMDVDLRVTWHSSDDRWRIWGGWEQQDWSGIAADLLRNFPGTATPLSPRDSVAFSGYLAGVSYRF